MFILRKLQVDGWYCGWVLSAHQNLIRITAYEFYKKNLSSLSMACGVMPNGALYSVYYAEASQIPTLEYML